MLTATLLEIPDTKITKCIGVVRGLTVLVPSTGQSWAAGWTGIKGGKSKGLVDMCDSARNEAFAQMVSEATKLGANAVLGVRYDANAVLGFGNEVLCYGTAVIVESA